MPEPVLERVLEAEVEAVLELRLLAIEKILLAPEGTFMVAVSTCSLKPDEGEAHVDAHVALVKL